MSGDDPIALGVGVSFEVRYPFIIDDFWNKWRPGVRMEFVAPDDTEAVADGVGIMILTVVSAHRPGRYPERIFYERRWRSPDNVEFGKPRLLMATTGKFRRIARRYLHEYRIAKGAMRAMGWPVTGES